VAIGICGRAGFFGCLGAGLIIAIYDELDAWRVKEFRDKQLGKNQ
jgi:hypothetical protein